MKWKKNKIINERINLQTYHIERFFDQNHKIHLHRRNDGFSPEELLGILEFIQLEILQQYTGNIKPMIIKREVVEREKP